MFEPSTLTTFFSTSAQIIGALVAILAAFAHFRILRLEEYLIGDGKAIAIPENWEANWAAIEQNYIIDNSIKNILKQRLEDGIVRKNVSEIGDVLDNLKEIAKRTEQSSERNSLIYIIDIWFNRTKKQINTLKKLTLVTVCVALISIVTSLFFLLQVDTIKTCECYVLKYVAISFSLTVISLILSGCIIYLGLAENTNHERDTDNPLDFSSINKRP